MFTFLVPESALSFFALICLVPSQVSEETRGAELPVATAPVEAAIQGELSDADRADLEKRLVAASYGVTPVEGGYESTNVRQRWSTRFDGTGFLTVPSCGGWSWGLELESFGRGKDLQVTSEPTCAEHEGSRVTYRWSELLEEWYVNDERGLEHGYTLDTRPRGSSTSSLAFGLGVRGSLSARVTSSGRGVQFLDENGVTTLTYSGLYVFDATGAEFEAHFEGSGNSLRLLVDDRGAQYPLTIDPVAQQAYLKASNREEEDGFGWSVAISGDTAVIGAQGEESGSPGVNGDQTDNSVLNAGAAYVFVRTSSGWSQQAYLKASNPDFRDGFGWAVAICGDTIAVGSSSTFPINPDGEDSAATGVNGNQLDESAPGSGAVYVFVRNGTTWSQQAYIKASNTEAFDHFGFSVALGENTLAVGAAGEDSNATGVNGDQSDNSAASSGAVYVFERTGTAWSQQAYLKASNTEVNDEFGRSVSISGDTLVVATPLEDSGSTGVNGDQNNNDSQTSGAAYVFVRSGTTWAQEAYLKASNTRPGDTLGVVSISGNTIVAGAPSEGSQATGVDGNQNGIGAFNSGAAYVFVRGASGWAQQAYLKASNTGTWDGFAGSVSISDDRILIGAFAECSPGVGVNGDQTSNSPCTSLNGAAYLFERNGVTWQQAAYLKPATAVVGSRFGRGVALDHNHALVSAYADSSAATGVNGDPSFGSVQLSGASYIFDLDAPSSEASDAASFCSGDGGDQMGCTNCPCMNNAASGSIGGCLNSVATSARLNASGSLSSSLPFGLDSDLRLSMDGAPPAALSLLQSADAAVPNDMASPCFGLSSGSILSNSDGLRCVAVNVRRHGIRVTDDTGEVGLGTSPWGGEGLPVEGIALEGSGFTSGQTRYFQVVYRDDMTLSCGRGLNSTQAVQLTFAP